MPESTQYLLIGGFAAGHAAQSIREHDKEGRVIVVGVEKHPPYDRPPLSKQFLVDDEFKTDDPYSKPDEYYPDNNIELRMGVKVTGFDRATRTVSLDNGDTIVYEKLLIATGATPRTLDVPGNDLQGVHYLRTIDDAEAIRRSMQTARRAVVIGASYMGMEVASDCVQRKLKTTVIEHNEQPWAKFASPELGRFMREHYEARGVHFLFSEDVSSFEGEDKLTAVLTRSGKRVETDLVVACTGVTLNTQLAQGAGLEVDEKHGIVVNEFLQTSDPNIWAAGDVACFEDRALGKRWHAEHYMNGKWQGQTAGAIMTGVNQPYDKVAYFFSDFLDLHMILRGDPQAGNHTTVRGDMKNGEFAELYYDDSGCLRMGVAISHDEEKLEPISDTLEQLIRARTKVENISAAVFEL